jgi:hypothetical protein
MGIQKDGCQGLQYQFRYDVDENAIELRYSFMSGVPAENGTIVDMHPFGQVLRMNPPKYKGRKPKADRVFSSSQATQEATQKAEELFSKQLGLGD